MDEELPIVDRYRLNKKDIKKLFCRFPNLKQVRICRALSLFKQFDDEICKEILECCPKLDVFENVGKTNDTLYNLRLLLTTIALDYIEKLTPQPLQYITNFPRLNALKGTYRYLNSFEDWLRIMQRLPNLKLPRRIDQYTGDRDNFAEEYMATLTEDEQTSLRMRLLDVHSVELGGFTTSSKNATKFVTKYLPNVTELRIAVFVDSDWGIAKLQEYCHEALDFIAPVKSRRSALFTFGDYYSSTLTRSFPFIADRVFSSLNSGNRILKIETSHAYSDDTAFHIEVSITSNTELNAMIHGELNINGIAQSLFGKGFRSEKIIPRHDIDEFVLSIQEYDLYISASTYLLFFQAMPSLKKVTLDVPYNFGRVSSDDEESYHEYEYDDYRDADYGDSDDGYGDDNSMDYDDDYGYYNISDTDDEERLIEEDIIKNTLNTKVEELTLRVYNEKPCLQSLLSTFNKALPNMKRLNLCYTGGVWQSSTKKYQILLPKFSLEVLTIDVTPVKQKMYDDVKVKHDKKKSQMYYNENSELQEKMEDMYYRRRRQALKGINKIEKKMKMLYTEDEDELEMAKETMLKEDWFLVDVESLHDNQRRLYKVAVNLSSVTSIDQADLEHYEHHFCMHVNIASLQSLQICAFYSFKDDSYSGGDYFSIPGSGSFKYITLFE